MKIEWITYKGFQILYSDYSGLSESEMISQMQEETRIILENKGCILYLANFTNTFISSDFTQAISADGKKTRRYIKKSAVVGITGIRSILLNAFIRISGIKAKAIDDLDKAKEYLVKDEVNEIKDVNEVKEEKMRSWGVEKLRR